MNQEHADIKGIHLTKVEARETFINKRKAITPEDLSLGSSKIAERVMINLDPKPNQNYHVFLPVKNRMEVDTWKIVEQLWKRKCNTITSITHFQSNTLSHWYFNEETTFQNNRWEIPEPYGANEAGVELLDVVLVPLLAIDERGHRVGYGRGYYDKFLATLPDQTLKAGLSLFDPIGLIEDINDLDVPLDVCFTPQKTVWFQPNLPK